MNRGAESVNIPATIGIPTMSEDSSQLISLHKASSPGGIDLRRVGAHPDYWYPWPGPRS